MPIYEYRCAECGLEVEKLQRKRERPTCCDRLMLPLPSAPTPHFKGSGFYVNDYKGKK